MDLAIFLHQGAFPRPSFAASDPPSKTILERQHPVRKILCLIIGCEKFLLLAPIFGQLKNVGYEVRTAGNQEVGKPDIFRWAPRVPANLNPDSFSITMAAIEAFYQMVFRSSPSADGRPSPRIRNSRRLPWQEQPPLAHCLHSPVQPFSEKAAT